MKNIINQTVLETIIKENSLTEIDFKKSLSTQKLAVNSFVDLSDTRTKTIQEIEQDLICCKVLPLRRNFCNNISAAGGVGKTTTSILLSVVYILEEKQKYNRSSKVLCWLSEDSSSDIRDRFNTVCNEILKINATERAYVLERLTIIDIETDIPVFLDKEKFGTIKKTEQYEAFLELIEDYSFVIIDPLLAFYSVCGFEENNNSEAKQFMMLFTAISQKMKKTFLMITHSSKNEIGIRGASAFRDAFRLSYGISKYQKKILDEEGKEVKDQGGNILMKDDINLSHLREVKILKDNSCVELYLRSNIDFFTFAYLDCFYIFKIQIFKQKSKLEIDRQMEVSNNNFLTYNQRLELKKRTNNEEY